MKEIKLVNLCAHCEHPHACTECIIPKEQRIFNKHSDGRTIIASGEDAIFDEEGLVCN